MPGSNLLKSKRGSLRNPESIDSEIRAVPLRRPLTWIAAILVTALLLDFGIRAAGNSAYQWDTFAAYIFDKRFPAAMLVTLELTVLSMVIAVVLGVILAVMRLSSNPVLKGISWLYLWIFRGVPVFVQLVFWGLLTTIYRNFQLGIPFTPAQWTFESGNWLNPFVAAILGLGLNQAAYTAEIIRAGILSVDNGQSEAATALGMNWAQTTWRIVLPQAMRFIVPPVGNEVIGLAKTTSLVTAIPLTTDIYSVSRQIGGALYQPIPLLLVASAWYLALTSLLMIGQYFVEKRFARGFVRTESKASTKTQLDPTPGGRNDA
jgi:polar amino acid transport system permease protein